MTETTPKKATKPKKPRLNYNRRHMRWETKSGTPKDPVMPVWAVKSGGSIPFGKFIREWESADELEDVHKRFWWKTAAQLKSQRRQINDWLDDQEISGLKSLPSGATRRKKWNRDLKKLIDEGVLTRGDGAEEDTGSSTIDRTGLGDIVVTM